MWKSLTRKFNRDKHFDRKHVKKTSFLPEKKFICPFCPQEESNDFKRKNLLVNHVDQVHLDSLVYKLKKSAFGGKISIFTKQLITLQLWKILLMIEER